MKKLFLIVVLSFNTAQAAELSDNDARKTAIEMLLTIDHAKKEFALAYDKRDYDLYRAKVYDKLLKKISEWPKGNLSNRAIFPYFECRQAADDYRNFTDTTFLGKPENRYEKDFLQNYSGCKKAIKKPDMSLKDIS